MIAGNCNISNVILSRFEYLKSVLQNVKRKSHGICMLIKRIDAIRGMYENGFSIIPGMIVLFSRLDGAHEAPEERRNYRAIEQAITIALDIMEKLGAKQIPLSKGDKFDPSIHKAVGIEEANLPDGSVTTVVYRGFRVGERIYYAEVIVAKNPNAERQEQGERVAVETVAQERSEKTSLFAAKAPGRKLCATYEEYRRTVREGFERLATEQGTLSRVEAHKEELLMVYLLDFDPMRKELDALYSPTKRGSEPCDPTAILRSMLLMNAFRQTSLTAWATEVRSDPILAVICGFGRKKPPSVGSYYNLMKRLEDGPYVPKCQHRIKASEMRRAQAPFRMPKVKPTEKKKPAPAGVLERLTEKLRETKDEPCPKDLERILNEILLNVAVKPSSERGIIEDMRKLTLAGDGSTVPSGACSNGKNTCDCRKKGIFRCDHLRKFSDMQANWGWDNRIEDFVFGYRYYQFVCADNEHDLPIYLSISSANTHEAVMSLNALDRMQKMFAGHHSQARIERISVDAIHDAYAYYRYLVHHRIRYAIPYAKQPAVCLELGEDGALFTDKGVPLCLGGLPMRRHGQDRQGRNMYACPIKRATRRNGRQVYVAHREDCPRQALCEPISILGPIVHVNKGIDPRIHPEIPRGSREYKQLSKMRTSAERSNSMKKERFRGKYTKTRVMPYAYIRLALSSLLEHSRVWAEEKLKEYVNLRENPLALFM